MNNITIQLIVLSFALSLSNSINAQVVTHYNKVKYIMPKDSSMYLYKVTVSNHSKDSCYLTWYNNRDIPKLSPKQIVIEHFFRPCGDFSLYDFFYENISNYDIDISKEFHKQLFVKNIKPQEIFIYFVFSKSADVQNVLNRIAIVNHSIYKKIAGVDMFRKWLYKDTECIIFDI